MTHRAASRSSPARRTRPARSGGRRHAGLVEPSPVARYAELSTQPLHMLAALVPLIIGFEIGSFLYLNAGNAVATVAAHRSIETFFERFGGFGASLPALAVVAVLLCWHGARRDPWTLRPLVVAGTWIEAAAWTLPLLTLLVVGGRLLPAAVVEPPGGELAAQIGGRATLAAGAGLYEELLFRMVLMAVADAFLSDILRLPKRTASAIAVAVSALAFALYHDVAVPGGGLDVASLVLYALAGTYLAVLYLWRGFAVVVWTHALYDVLVLLKPFALG